jgi:hypothetical protein
VTEGQSTTSETGDDLSIPDDEVLYRRLSYDNGDWIVRNQITGERVRPASGAFKPDEDGVSVFRQSILQQARPPLGPQDVAVTAENVIVGFSVGDVRSLSLGVRDDAWPQDVPDPKHPRYAAHALIIGLEAVSKNARIRCQKQLAELRSMTFVSG